MRILNREKPICWFFLVKCEANEEESGLAKFTVGQG